MIASRRTLLTAGLCALAPSAGFSLPVGAMPAAATEAARSATSSASAPLIDPSAGPSVPALSPEQVRSRNIESDLGHLAVLFEIHALLLGLAKDDDSFNGLSGLEHQMQVLMLDLSQAMDAASFAAVTRAWLTMLQLGDDAPFKPFGAIHSTVVDEAGVLLGLRMAGEDTLLHAYRLARATRARRFSFVATDSRLLGWSCAAGEQLRQMPVDDEQQRAIHVEADHLVVPSWGNEEKEVATTSNALLVVKAVLKATSVTPLSTKPPELR